MVLRVPQHLLRKNKRIEHKVSLMTNQERMTQQLYEDAAVLHLYHTGRSVRWDLIEK